jgi:predicted kinase
MSEKNLNLVPKTMIFMVGPSCCGKSTVAHRIKNALHMQGLTCTIISSDDCRRELLGVQSMDNMHPHMMPVSKQAFELLETKARLHMSFPVNTDVVIIDSTGMDHEMRKQFNILAKDQQYRSHMIVFDLGLEELMKNVESRKGLEHVTRRHHKTLREKVMPALDRKYWDELTMVKSREELDALVPVWGAVVTHEYPESQVRYHEAGTKIAVIGDAHECVNELRELVGKLPADAPLYLIGDMFDKGGNTFAMIDYLWELLAAGRIKGMLKGNHENYVMRRLLGQIQPNAEIEATYMTAVAPLLENAEYREKFLSLDPFMHRFLRIVRPDAKDIYLTHAPVKNRHIGKFDKNSLRNQINFRFESRELADMQKELAFIGEEATRNHPWHVFGHVAHEDAKPFMQHNKIWLDTGCVHGNKLSAVVFDGDQVNFVSVKAAREYSKSGGGLFSFKKGFDLDALLVSEVKLSEEEEDQVRRVTKGGAKFISGTMSPAPSVVKDGQLDIESLREGLQFYANMGVRELVIQPKFMGSRAQAYIYKDPEKNFFTSRNGFKVRYQDEALAFAKTLTETYASRVPFENELILDGELLPWAALGRGLIEKDFGYYAVSISEELGALYGDDVVRSLTNIPINIEEKTLHLGAFCNQLGLYGSPAPMRYEAFGILSVDGKSWMRADNDHVWFMVNNGEFVVIDPTTKEGIESAHAFFTRKTFEEGYEGVVLKPKKFVPGALPYMKVRNPEYLRLIYGYDYPDRLEALCRQKNVRRKADVALKEYQMGMAMLEFPEHREKLISAFFGQIQKERELDPRL